MNTQQVSKPSLAISDKATSINPINSSAKTLNKATMLVLKHGQKVATSTKTGVEMKRKKTITKIKMPLTTTTSQERPTKLGMTLG